MASEPRREKASEHIGKAFLEAWDMANKVKLVSTGPIWEVTAFGDVVYVDAPTREACEQIIAREMGGEVVALCAYRIVAAVPDGEGWFDVAGVHDAS